MNDVFCRKVSRQGYFGNLNGQYDMKSCNGRIEKVPRSIFVLRPNQRAPWFPSFDF